MLLKYVPFALPIIGLTIFGPSTITVSMAQKAKTMTCKAHNRKLGPLILNMPRLKSYKVQ